MIVTVGDLVVDVATEVLDELRLDADASSSVLLRQGGSAANVAVEAVRAGGAARFCGRVGDDRWGDLVVAELRAAQVEVLVERVGRTGVIVVLLDERGRRTMLTDRAASASLSAPPAGWARNVSAVHVPAYALLPDDATAATGRRMLAEAPARAIRSVDASSATLLDDGGDQRLADLCAGGVDVLLANAREAEALGLPDQPLEGPAIQVVKRGPEPALVLVRGVAREVPAEALDVVDTVGAGDAFAAGMLVALAGGADPVTAAGYGHSAASRRLRWLAAGGPTVDANEGRPWSP